MATFRLELTDDSRKVRFRIKENPEVDYQFDAAGIDSLIVKLGTLRARMKPRHQENKVPLPKGGRHVRQEGGEIAVTHRSPDQVALHLNDERYGWLHYYMSRKRAAELAGRLLTNPASILPPIMGGRPN
ncbi:hypothetical protein [Reyranella sp.]|uniref:hypothetical protein n=1 Tax=Reyranella sp. TaxID=1929291 RepID=UPI003D0C58D2